MTISNTKWVLKSRPSGLVKEDNFELITEELSELNGLLENSSKTFD